MSGEDGAPVTSEPAEYNFPKPTVLHADMPQDMQDYAFQKSFESFSAHKIEKDQAATVKRAFEEKFGGTWHCVIGKSFGCSVANETGFIVFFKMERANVLLFQSLDEDAIGTTQA